MSKSEPLGLKPSFGFGDRLGTATPGHLEALVTKGGDIKGIFAQQSIREMTRTNRTADEVMNCAIESLDAAGYTDVWGSDADHLKTEADVDYTAAAGFVFFTIDPSGNVDNEADNYDVDTLATKFDAVKDEVSWVDQYLNKTIAVDNGPTIEFDEVTVRRAAVKYGRAINHTIALGDYIGKVMDAKGADHEIELSVDETPQPTTTAEHYIFADQVCQANKKLVSLAPRFIGDFEKGIDFKGSLEELDVSLNEHAAIARALGPYKLSLHSGSDKLSMYGIFAKATQGMFHVKTAGTSYLEALRAVSRHDEALYRKIVDFSRGRFETDKATYHISATLDGVATPDDVSDLDELVRLYQDEDCGRQILHVTFGSVLTHEEFGPGVHAVLNANPETHKEVLATHIGKHFDALRSGMA